MPDLAMGRKEIMKALHVTNWDTIRKWRKKDPGFRKLVRKNRITGRPFIVISEVQMWLVELDNVRRKKEGS